MKTRITIIGAGSATFSAGIVRDLCVNKGLEGSHITFMDIDENRLEMIVSLAKRIIKELDMKYTFSITTDRQKALKDAKFIINMAQIGGHEWAEHQRNLGTKHNYYRGAWLHYLAQMIFFVDLVKDVEEICPDALLIQSANPVFEGCSLLHRISDVNVLGLCHGHYAIKHIAEVLGLETEYVTSRCIGFNHYIWMTEFRYKGHDAYPILEKWIEDKAEEYWNREKIGYADVDMSRAAINLYKLYGLMPVGDTIRLTGWWYHSDIDAKKKWFGKPFGGKDSHLGWAEHLKKMENNINTIEALINNEKTKVTDIFKPVQSGEQIVPIINSIVNNEIGVYQVNIPNRGNIIKGIPEDAVVEIQGVVDGIGIRGIDEPALPKNLMIKGMIPRWNYAELLIEAVIQKDFDLLLMYMLEDHRTRNYEQAKDFLDEMFNDEQNSYLKNYFNI